MSARRKASAPVPVAPVPRRSRNASRVGIAPEHALHIDQRHLERYARQSEKRGCVRRIELSGDVDYDYRGERPQPIQRSLPR